MIAPLRSIADLDAACREQQRRRETFEKRVAVCNGTGCRACGGLEVIESLRDALEQRGLSDRVEILPTGCQGFCQRGPLVGIEPDGILYLTVQPEDAQRIVTKTIEGGQILEDLVYRDLNGRSIPLREETGFYGGQTRILLGGGQDVDPTSIGDAIGRDAYRGLAIALHELSPDEVIERIERSGLRGRGGAGFSTGRKWRLTREAVGDRKYAVCNADEGDPGAFMDRSLIEATPHTVLEGVVIAAYAVGANEAYVYVRAEYPLAVEHMRRAIADARAAGLLGDCVLGSSFHLDVQVVEGAGAFVCGEETALLESIEGRRGMPRFRPPFPAEAGLQGSPTTINNVETLANVPRILREGPEAFAAIGTARSLGTKVFSLTGKVLNNGLVEVPLGTPLRQIVESIGGGGPEGRSIKAVQLGGPSGGCLPASLLDVPIDYESLEAHGAILGSGGVIVLDDCSCMVDVARYFLDFTANESCGKCVPCRVGVPTMRDILTRICIGDGREGDLDELRSLAELISRNALCGLGRTAPNPVLSILRYFEEEVREHIDGRCPAGVCMTPTPPFQIDPARCVSCGACAKICPTAAIQGAPGTGPYAIGKAACIRCGACEAACPVNAIARSAPQ